MISLVNLAAALVALIMLPSATARLSRLVWQDEILNKPRAWIIKKSGPAGFLARLLDCYWCVSVWVALFVCPFCWTVITLLDVWPVWTCVCLGLLSIPAVAYEASRKIDREGV